MRIKLSPDANISNELLVVKAGDALIINGETFDFTQMGFGDTLPLSAISSTWFRGDVEKLEDGELVVTLALPNGPNASPEQRFPEDLVGVLDGVVAFPQPLPVLQETSEEEV